MSSCSAGRAGLPERLLDPVFGVRGSREDEEEVGEAVEVPGGERVRVRNREHRALGTTADGAREEEPRGPFAPAGQDEALQVGKRLVRRVDLLFEPLDGL